MKHIKSTNTMNNIMRELIVENKYISDINNDEGGIAVNPNRQSINMIEPAPEIFQYPPMLDRL